MPNKLVTPSAWRREGCEALPTWKLQNHGILKKYEILKIYHGSEWNIGGKFEFTNLGISKMRLKSKILKFELLIMFDQDFAPIHSWWQVKPVASGKVSIPSKSTKKWYRIRPAPSMRDPICYSKTLYKGTPRILAPRGKPSIMVSARWACRDGKSEAMNWQEQTDELKYISRAPYHLSPCARTRMCKGATNLMYQSPSRMDAPIKIQIRLRERVQ